MPWKLSIGKTKSEVSAIFIWFRWKLNPCTRDPNSSPHGDLAAVARFMGTHCATEIIHNSESVPTLLFKISMRFFLWSLFGLAWFRQYYGLVHTLW